MFNEKGCIKYVNGAKLRYKLLKFSLYLFIGFCFWGVLINLFYVGCYYWGGGGELWYVFQIFDGFDFFYFFAVDFFSD